MQITFKDKKLRALCELQKKAHKKLGVKCARKLRSTLSDLTAAQSVTDLISGRPHPLKGNLAGKVAGNEKSLPSEQEDQADQWSRNFLIPPKYNAELLQLHSKEKVKLFANRIGIHPGIVVGRLQHDQTIPQSHMNRPLARISKK